MNVMSMWKEAFLDLGSKISKSVRMHHDDVTDSGLQSVEGRLVTKGSSNSTENV